MNKSFPKEKYQEICRGLQPSRESVREVITMKEPKNIPESNGKPL